ncbi:hypothetical protein SVAN01_02085 [Stagonosporopsis vannaccii]|nr:hypothetical protein SVAN01_02085 [Stagonosporopsis vannaccii]
MHLATSYMRLATSYMRLATGYMRLVSVSRSISTVIVAERKVPEGHVERILPGSGKSQVPRDGGPSAERQALEWTWAALLRLGRAAGCAVLQARQVVSVGSLDERSGKASMGIWMRGLARPAWKSSKASNGRAGKAWALSGRQARRRHDRAGQGRESNGHERRAAEFGLAARRDGDQASSPGGAVPWAFGTAVSQSVRAGGSRASGEASRVRGRRPTRRACRGRARWPATGAWGRVGRRGRGRRRRVEAASQARRRGFWKSNLGRARARWPSCAMGAGAIVGEQAQRARVGGDAFGQRALAAVAQRARAASGGLTGPQQECEAEAAAGAEALSAAGSGSVVEGGWGVAHSASGNLHSRRAADPNAPPAPGGPSPAARHPRSPPAWNSGQPTAPKSAKPLHPQSARPLHPTSTGPSAQRALNASALSWAPPSARTQPRHAARPDSPQPAEPQLAAAHPLVCSPRRRRGIAH